MISKGIYKDAKILFLRGKSSFVSVNEMNQKIEDVITAMEQEPHFNQCLDTFQLFEFDDAMYAALTFAPVISEE